LRDRSGLSRIAPDRIGQRHSHQGGFLGREAGRVLAEEELCGGLGAAQFFFRKNASRLTPEEAALMAVTLPDPIGRDAGEPGPIAQRLAARLRKRMEAANVRCVVD